MQVKQITIPVMIPSELEHYLLSTIPQQFDDLPAHFVDSKALIPVHDSSRYDASTATIPSLLDSATEGGNLRYWVITNESMWALQHRVMDEFSELMWALFYCFAGDVQSLSGVQTPEARWRLAGLLRRRNVLPEIQQYVPSNKMDSGLSNMSEALLFRRWALLSPSWPIDRIDPDDEIHELFLHDQAALYPFPDELFWEDGDEGV